MPSRLRLVTYFFRGLLLSLAIGGCRAEATANGLPCVLYNSGVHPLVVGDSTRLEVGALTGSDCRHDQFRLPVRWQTASSSVVTLRTDGQLAGLAPGVFRAVARLDTTALSVDGFVVPRVWKMSAVTGAPFTLRVGESLRLALTAEDSAGKPLPQFPFSIYTPEFLHPEATQAPLFDKYSFQNVTSPVVFIARRAGRTALIGQIGDERIPISVTVLPAQ